MSGLATPTPYQWQVADIGSASLLNAQLFNGLTYMLGPPVFVGYQATVQSIPNSSWTALSLDATTTDPYGGHSNSTNNSRYTCQAGVAGYYTCCGVYASASNSSGFRAVTLQVNGTHVVGSSVYSPNNGSVEVGVATPVKDVYLNAGDYIEVAGWQSSGGALNTILDVDLRCGLWVRFSHV
jgi:hypothetical protein